MAIKVNGTTVIDDNRNLVNIASGAGSSTASMAVGTYALLSGTTGNVFYGTTYSGSSLFPASAKGLENSAGDWTGAGTWRQMGFTSNGFGDYNATVFVRIS